MCPGAFVYVVPAFSGVPVRTRRPSPYTGGTATSSRAGALDPDRPIVASLLFGDADLLAWVDGNPRRSTVDNLAPMRRNPDDIRHERALQGAVQHVGRTTAALHEADQSRSAARRA